jgi:hypothetical protein
MPLLLFGCPLFARFLIPSQVKPVAVKRHRKRVRLKTDAPACHTKWILDGGGIFAEWPESQQQAFCKAAGISNSDRNEVLLVIGILKELQSVPFRRAESEFQEGHLENI